MPDPNNFTVDDVLGIIFISCRLLYSYLLENVGRDRKIEVVEVCTQNGRLMNLSDFIDYYKFLIIYSFMNFNLRKPVNERQELLNVLSLEFSSTPLANLVFLKYFLSFYFNFLRLVLLHLYQK